MNKYIKSVIVLIIFITIQIGYSMDKKNLDLYDLYNLLQNNNESSKEIVVTFDGELQEGYFSKKKYIFLEDVIYFGEPDIKSTSYSPNYNENNFFLIYKKSQYSINFRKIRTFLSASFTKTFNKSDIEIAPQVIKKILQDTSTQSMICEYGLKPKKKYFAFFTEELYYVNGPKGPQRKKNLVLYISDKHFENGKPKVEITPLYSGWTY